MSTAKKDAHCSRPFMFDVCVRAVFRVHIERLPRWFPHVMNTLLSRSATKAQARSVGGMRGRTSAREQRPRSACQTTPG